jgi:hypothetical protein
MAADEAGNDLSAVAVPLTGTLGYAPVDAENVIAKADLGAATLDAPAAFKILGLVKSDGGAQDDSNQDDAQEFYQDGYKLAGDGSLTVEVNLAQFDANVRELIHGIVPDENGVIEVNSITPDTTFILLHETVYKNGFIRRRIGVARISAVKPDQEERGSVFGNDVTFEWVRHELFNNAFYWEAMVPPAGVLTVAPASASIAVDGTQQLTASQSGATWASSDATKATVSASGLVTGVAVGTVTITATVGSSTATSVITVTA